MLQPRVPIPKVKRIVDQDLIDRIRESGSCQIFGCNEHPLHVHHIKSKGSGGDDVSENLVRVCWKHHAKIHSGNIARDVLRKLALKRIQEEAA